MSYQAKFLNSRQLAKDTMLFEFEKPADFDFQAGQFINMTVQGEYTDETADCRFMSMASAPYEDQLSFGMRMSKSAFKRNLQNLKTGDHIELSPPSGRLTLQSAEVRPIFGLLGGIGITPMRSIVRQMLHQQKENPVTLLYSNRTADDAAWLDEFSQLAEQHGQIEFVPTMTREKNWSGEQGRIDKQMIKKYLPANDVLYYVVGYPQFVMTIQQYLSQLNIPRENIKFEAFFAY